MLAGIIIAAQRGAQLNKWKQEQIGLLINGLPGLKLAPVAQSKMQRALPTDTEPKANSDLGDRYEKQAAERRMAGLSRFLLKWGLGHLREVMIGVSPWTCPLV